MTIRVINVPLKCNRTQRTLIQMMIADNEIISYNNYLRYQRSIEIASVLEAADGDAVSLEEVLPLAPPIAYAEKSIPSAAN